MLTRPHFLPEGYDPANPWESDLTAERRVLAETLTRYCDESGGPFVFSVSGPWGTGKSLFLTMWRDWLHNECPTSRPCFLFNAWKHDFTRDPFTAFALALDRFIDANPVRMADWLRTEAKSVVHKAAECLEAPIVAGMEIVGALAGTGLAATPEGQRVMAAAGGAVSKSVSRAVFDSFRAKALSRSDFTVELARFGQAVLDRFGAPLFVMVDELDRCKPSFAVELLENIKHLFSVPGIVFVLAVESRQFRQCLRNAYGFDDDGARRYLGKFVDLSLALPGVSKDFFVSNTVGSARYPIFLEDLELGGGETYTPLEMILDAVPAANWPEPREIQKIAMVLSVLSARDGMDHLSLVVCARALVSMGKDDCSAQSALESAFPQAHPLRPTTEVSTNPTFEVHDFFGLKERTKLLNALLLDRRRIHFPTSKQERDHWLDSEEVSPKGVRLIEALASGRVLMGEDWIDFLRSCLEFRDDLLDEEPS